MPLGAACSIGHLHPQEARQNGLAGAGAGGLVGFSEREGVDGRRNPQGASHQHLRATQSQRSAVTLCLARPAGSSPL